MCDEAFRSCIEAVRGDDGLELPALLTRAADGIRRHAQVPVPPACAQKGSPCATQQSHRRRSGAKHGVRGREPCNAVQSLAWRGVREHGAARMRWAARRLAAAAWHAAFRVLLVSKAQATASMSLTTYANRAHSASACCTAVAELSRQHHGCYEHPRVRFSGTAEYPP